MIAIRNIYYMLSYAFRILQEQGYKKVGTEEFGNTAELCAAILVKGISIQVKRGLRREYVPVTTPSASPRGKLELAESLKDQTLVKKQLVCSYDEFSLDSYMNRIIKSTFLLLLRSDISKERKKNLRKLLFYFKNVRDLDVHQINWDLQYDKNNKSYQMLISICYLVIHGLLQTQSDGSTKLMDFLDDQRMSQLYEKFILEYYRREWPMLHANASQIQWALDYGDNDFLPEMRSDIMLKHGIKTLIIDAKYYGSTMQTRFNKKTLHSANLYQIFTYVKNEQAKVGTDGDVSGMLLYARTDEDIQPDCEYHMSGNTIWVRTLDLNEDFQNIKDQLDQIAETFFETKDNLDEKSWH